ncbi:hypothetical protein [Flaviaesturariibacter aridisoli]|uniref:Lipoprotein n=1 Tax=Flaviaesturariibacter aridisoli TaxID=2545761 RepID=A0A4R4E0I9_9BACT|nr:hypothetical protein [Flaviaesturariibacter aridisoli]TCZ70482.1 hypothetical protein E0486_11030 [Flaviaesturariibacter aridisoli]
MKRIIPVLPILIVLAACNASDNSDAPASSDTLVTKAHDEQPVETQATALTALFSVMKGVDAGFDPKNFSAFADDGSLAPDTLRFDRREFENWKPWLLYNADSSRAIDLVSYNYTIERRGGRAVLEGAGPDMQIAALDFPKGTRRQLLFAGPGALSLDAVWSDPHTVLLAQAQLEGRGQDRTYRYRVLLHKYDLASGRRWTSTYPTLLTGNPADLVQKDFEK